MAVAATTGIARRRANVRRIVIATLVIACLAIFTGYFREFDRRPLARGPIDRREHRRARAGGGHPGHRALPRRLGMGEQPQGRPRPGGGARGRERRSTRPRGRQRRPRPAPGRARVAASASRPWSTPPAGAGGYTPGHRAGRHALDHRLVPQRPHLGRFLAGRRAQLARRRRHRSAAPRWSAWSPASPPTPPTSPSSPTAGPRWAPRSPRPATRRGWCQSTTPGQLKLTGVPRAAPVDAQPGRRDLRLHGQGPALDLPARHPDRAGLQRRGHRRWTCSRRSR